MPRLRHKPSRPDDVARPSASSVLQPRRIVVRGVNWLGDAVMATPALRRLREAFPDARLTLLTPEKLAALWPHHPDLDAAMTFAPGEGVWSVARRLRREKFDLAVVLPNSPRSALESFLARIPYRVGYRGKWRRFFLTHTVEPRPGLMTMHKRTVREVRQLVLTTAPRAKYPLEAHHVHHYLRLVAALGLDGSPLAPRLGVADEEVAAFRRKFGFSAEWTPLFGLNPGAEYGPAKRWIERRFVDSAVTLHRRTNCRWVILGGQGDAALAEGIRREIVARIGDEAVRSIAGQTTLRELCAAFKACGVVVTNDTGPMHVAAAVGTPVVVPFGSTSPELTGPGLPGSDGHAVVAGEAPCAPCFLRQCPIDFRCMDNVIVGSVVVGALRLWRARSGADAPPLAE